jgi:hypothetical protein
MGNNDLLQENQESLLCKMSITDRIIGQQKLTTRLPVSKGACLTPAEYNSN